MLITDHRKNSGCDYHRTQLPLKYMPPLNLTRPTLFINRDTYRPISWLKQFKRDGGRFVYDVDDAIDLPPEHPLAKVYKTNQVRERYAALLALADVVTVTTDKLAQHFRHMTKAPIEVLPNALPFDRDQFTRSTRFDDRPLIWAGGMSHEVDLRLIKDAVDGRQIALAGYQRTEPWYAMIRMFPGCLVKPALSVGSYMTHYDGHRIALAPLATSDFAACKSNLKILEAGAKGLPIICSATPPYRMKRRQEIPGVDFAGIGADWCWLIERHLATPGYSADQGAKLAEHVRENYHLDAVNEHRRQILEG